MDVNDTVLVQAVVPLQEGFARLLEKNTQILLSKAIYYRDEELDLSIVLRASGEEILRFHPLEIDIISETGESREKKLFFSDKDGVASIRFGLGSLSFGRYRISARDYFYSERILFFDDEPTFALIDRPNDEEENDFDTKKQKSSLTSQESDGNPALLQPIVRVTVSLETSDGHAPETLHAMRAGP